MTAEIGCDRELALSVACGQVAAVSTANCNRCTRTPKQRDAVATEPNRRCVLAVHRYWCTLTATQRERVRLFARGAVRSCCGGAGGSISSSRAMCCIQLLPELVLHPDCLPRGRQRAPIKFKTKHPPAATTDIMSRPSTASLSRPVTASFSRPYTPSFEGRNGAGMPMLPGCSQPDTRTNYAKPHIFDITHDGLATESSNKVAVARTLRGDLSMLPEQNSRSETPSAAQTTSFNPKRPFTPTFVSNSGKVNVCGRQNVYFT